MGHPKCIAGVFETISKDDIIKITVAAIYLYQGDATLITSSGSSTPTLQSITKYKPMLWVILIVGWELWFNQATQVKPLSGCVIYVESILMNQE